MDDKTNAIIELVFQYCYIEEKKTYYEIDNACLSANENACRVLKELGIIYKYNGRMARIKKKTLKNIGY